MPERDYRADGITIHWSSDLCIHSANCLRALPSVFDTSARPWIQPGDTPVDDLAAAVDSCPSRALTYTRTDGGADGPGARSAAGSGDAAADGAADGGSAARGTGDAAQVVTVHVKDAGPLAVVGPVRVVDASGAEVVAGDRVFLCRCGTSRRKPQCDGSHKRNGFQG